MKPQRIYIVKYQPTGCKYSVDAQVVNPAEFLMRVAQESPNGLSHVTVSPLMINDKHVYLFNGKRVTI